MYLESAAASDVGRVRTSNEDAFLVRPDVGLFAIADGMGGHAAGEVASRMAIETLDRLLDTADLSDDPATTLARALADANRAVFQRAAAEEDKSGMGTTLTALLLRLEHARYHIAHVGDSRVYRLRAGRLTRLTTDHTLVQQLVDQRLLNPAQARRHPLTNVLYRSIGNQSDVETELLIGAVAPGDTFLLCSDGLTAALEDDELATLLAHEDSPLQALFRELIAAANERGGPDNITVVLVRAAAAPPRAGTPPQPHPAVPDA